MHAAAGMCVTADDVCCGQETMRALCSDVRGLVGIRVGEGGNGGMDGLRSVGLE